MAKKTEQEDLTSKKTEHLKALVAAGEVSTPAEAHRALKSRFQSSLNFKQMGPILRKGKPRKRGGKRRTGTAKRGATPGTSRKGRANGNARYAIITSGRGIVLVASRSDALREIDQLLHKGEDVGNLSLYERVNLKVRTQYKIEV